jgi:hypothetical protein
VVSGTSPLEDVQVGAADCRRVDPDDDVGRVDDRRVLDGIPAALAWAVVHEGFHDSTSSRWPA